MIYKWKTSYFKTPADVAGKELERIEESVGLTAKNVVDESRPEDAPLHKEFTWDDTVAAEKYREQEARVLMCNLIVEVETGDTTTRTKRFVNLRSASNGNYESIETVLSSEEKTSVLLDNAKKELKWFKTKYATLKELRGVFAEIDKL